MEAWLILTKSLLTQLVLLPVNVAWPGPLDNNVLHPRGWADGLRPLLNC